MQSSRRRGQSRKGRRKKERKEKKSQFYLLTRREQQVTSWNTEGHGGKVNTGTDERSHWNTGVWWRHAEGPPPPPEPLSDLKAQERWDALRSTRTHPDDRLIDGWTNQGSCKYKISLKIFKIYLYFYTLCKLNNNLMIRKINIQWNVSAIQM